jgi:hypothetical protein
MSQKKKSALLLAILAAAAAGAALIAGLGSGEDEPRDDALVSEGGSAPVPAAESGESSGERTGDLDRPPGWSDPLPEETTVVYPLEIELSLLQRGGAVEGDVLPLGSGASARISGSVTGPTGMPANARVVFTHGPNTGRELRTEATGKFGAADLYQGLSIVRVQTDSGLVTEREVNLRQLAEAQLNVSFGGTATVGGFVKNVKGEPIPNAKVTLDGRTEFTDQTGLFFFARVTAGTGILAHVEAEGYARYRELISISHSAGIAPEKLTFTLEGECKLELSVAESLGAPGEPAYVFVLPAGGQRTGLQQRSFPWHLVNPVEVQAGGRVTVDKLPPVTVTLVLFKSGAIAVPAQVNKKLLEGRVNQEELHLRPGPVVRGRVLADGEPVVGARVRLQAPNRALASTRVLGKRPDFNLQMIMPHLPAGLQEVRSDRSGAFVLSVHPELDERYYLSAESADGELAASQVVRVGRTDLELHLEPREDARGRLDIVMGGRHQGLPVEVRIQGVPRDPFVLAETEPLLIEDLEPGIWRADLRWRGSTVSGGERFEVRAGARSELRVVLPKGALEGQTLEERRRAGQ